MEEFGLTKYGPNPKRLDVILDEMNAYLKEKTGYDTKDNPQSLLNVLLTNVADRIAELWEFGEEVYDSMYPFSAQGINLDNAAQFSGAVRSTGSTASIYVLCTTTDDAIISEETTALRLDSTPTKEFIPVEQYTVGQSECNKAIATIESRTNGFVGIKFGSKECRVEYGPDTYLDKPLTDLAKVINAGDYGFTATVDTLGKPISLALQASSYDKTGKVEPLGDLQFIEYSAYLYFTATESGYTDILPDCPLEIVKSPAEVKSITLEEVITSGSNPETDIEFRKRYANRIFRQSRYMTESIEQAIIDNVPGVKDVAVFENDTQSEVDGIRPHSIEVVVAGGPDKVIGKTILEAKAAGIGTSGNSTVYIKSNNDTASHSVDFSRPKPVYVWFQAQPVLDSGYSAVGPFVGIIRDEIVKRVSELKIGEGVSLYLFRFNIPGIRYVRLTLATSESIDARPSSGAYTGIYDVAIGPKEIAFTSKEMIEVFAPTNE